MQGRCTQGGGAGEVYPGRWCRGGVPMQGGGAGEVYPGRWCRGGVPREVVQGRCT